MTYNGNMIEGLVQTVKTVEAAMKEQAAMVNLNPTVDQQIAKVEKLITARRSKRNAAARARYQAHRDCGLVKTPYGWE